MGLLKKAYASPSKMAFGTVDGKSTLAIAGTSSALDWLTDAAYLFGMERFVPGNRFSAAAKEYARRHPDRVIGHSLGGAVAAQYPHSVGYNPYVLPVGPHAFQAPDRVERKTGDIVSLSAVPMYWKTHTSSKLRDPLTAHVL